MKNYYSVALMLAITLSASAQTQKSSVSGSEVFIVPKVLSYDEKASVVSVSEDKDVSVYDDDITLVRTFHVNLPTYKGTWETQRRKAEGKAYSQNESIEYYDELTWNGAKEWANNSYAYGDRGMVVKDNYQFWPEDESYYWNYGEFGKTYPTSYYYWNPEDGHIYGVTLEYTYAYTGEWETVNSSSWEDSGMQKLYFEDYDDNSHPDQGFLLSQTLFNDDDKFEYVVCSYVAEDRINGEYDRDDDGMIDERNVEHGWKVTGYDIMSEDGTVLFSIESDKYFDWGESGVIKLNGKYYFLLTDGDETDFYKIDKQSAGISKVNALSGLKKQVFGTDGKARHSMQRGINIIRNEDGTVIKRVLK